MTMELRDLTIARRFCGPPNSANGGYACGLLAQHIDGPAVVRLKAPPPLETRLQVESDGETAVLRHGSSVIAEARRGDPGLVPPVTPSHASATAALKQRPRTSRLFAGCFACGPQRAKGDGLRVFPGVLGDGPNLAAPWVPEASLAGNDGCVQPEYLWAALDCAGGFAIWPDESTAILLGEFCARIDNPVKPGDECVVVAWPLGAEGRKRYAGTAVLDGAGRVAAIARATWIEVPRETVLAGRAPA